jgi:hypothetical protein
MGDEGLNRCDHSPVANTDLSQGFDQGFAGFLQLGAVGLAGASPFQTRGQTLAERQHGRLSPELSEGPGSGLPQAIILIGQGRQQLSHHPPIPDLAKSSGRITRHSVALDASANLPWLAELEGLQQEGHGSGMLAAHLAEPPGRVVLEGRVCTAKAPVGFRFGDGLTGGGKGWVVLKHT